MASANKTKPVKDDGDFAERLAALKNESATQLLEEAKLNAAVAQNLTRVKL